MLDFLSSRMQKAISKIKSKTTLSEEDFNEIIKEIKLALLEADVNLLVVKEFINSIKAKALDEQIVGKLNPFQHVVKIVNEQLIKVLGSETKDVEFKGNPTIIMMVGLQGSGKTTSSAKIVKYMMKKKNITKPLMIAADIYRPAAIEQLKTLGKELQIDVFAKDTKTNPRDIVSEGVQKAKNENYDLVVIDTAGRLSIDELLMKELIDIKNIVNPHEILFVVDALSGQDIINVAKTFNDNLKLSGSVITKLDSDTRGGAAFSISYLLNLPIKFVGVGEKVNSLELFHPDRMANRILGMGDVLSLIEKVEESFDEKKSQKMINRMVNGNFDLNDLMNQLSQMKKLGKMSKLIKMIPGMSDAKISDAKLDSAENKFRLYEIIISSMTNEERKKPKLLKNNSRKMRILKGSGRSVQEYNQLVNDFDRMQKQMLSISKSIKDGTFNPSMMKGFGK